MTNSALRFALTSLAALALAGAAALAGEGPASGATEAAASSPPAPRTLAYFANYRHDPTLMADLGMLMDACQKGHMTHVIVGLFHCDWLNRPEGMGACVSLNGLYLDDPTLQPLWEAVRLLQARKIKVIASFGGGGVGDYHHLLDPAHPEWYAPLRAMLRERHLDGLDMDIEESGNIVATKNVRRILKKLRRDFGDGFLITSAPVASALTGGSNISSGINYKKLMKEGWFTWYNLQFYNGFGDVLGGAYGSPDYEAVLRANKDVSPRKFVAGVPTSPASAGGNYHALSALTPKLRELAATYPGFGGVYGWTFQEAQVEGQLDPVGWMKGVAEAVRPEKDSQPETEEASMRSPRPGSKSAAPLYTFHALGAAAALPTAINANGDVVGWTTEDGQAFLAPRGGAMRPLGTFPGGHGSQATAVNASGQAAGWSDDGHYDVRAFLKEGSQQMADLGTLPGGSQSRASAINDGGEIAGWSFTSDALAPHAFLRDSAGAMVDLGTLGGAASQATALAPSAVQTKLAGWAQDAAASWQACYLPGDGTAMKSVLFSAKPQASQVAAIGLIHDDYLGDSNFMAGWALMPAGFDAFLWTAGSPVDLFGTRIGSQAAATAANAKGEAVGWYLDGRGACRAFLVSAGGQVMPQDLNGLMENPPPGDSLMIATGINDSGWIVGQTLGGKPFLLVPMSERNS